MALVNHLVDNARPISGVSEFLDVSRSEDLWSEVARQF